jgi:phosphonate transport system permease protein
MSSLIVNTADRERLIAAHGHIFQRSFLKRWGMLIGIIAATVYLALCFVFFNVGPAFMNGQWDRASIYVQDWYSWRAQPRLRFTETGVTPQWSSRRQYPADARIDWLTPTANGGYTVTYSGTNNRLEVTPQQVDVYLHGTAYPVTITADAVTAPAGAPAAIQQDGSKVTVNFGFAGQAEIRPAQVYVQRRFFGWANFLFDTDSKFWGKSYGELAHLALIGNRVDPEQTNIGAMVNDFLGNKVWQHADILSKMGQTLVMAFVGTLLGTLFAFPLAFIAARNITANRTANWVMKRLFDFLRSIDMLIWALFFTRGFGPGPIPGIAAIFFTDTGALGKVYSEALENVDDKQREGVKSVGASPALVNRFGVMPQVLPVFISQSLYFWESNTRSATVIGAVGAGGIGLKLLEAMGTNADWDKVAYMVVMILVVVFAFDGLSNALRARVTGKRT